MSVSNKKADTKTLKDEIWAILKEIAESQKKGEKQMEEFREDIKKSKEEFDLSMKKSEEKHDREMEKFRENLEKSREEFNLSIEKINGTMGSWSHNIGDFAEEYFQNSFEQGKKNFFGEHFDNIESNVKNIEPRDEYDIVLTNEKYVGIIEVKFKGHVNNIPDILKKANNFRDDFPKYKEHKIYLGLASMSFYKELEEKCKNEGIAIIKQVGDNVIITDEHLKAF